MEFDKSRVYSAANADELKVGSKIIVADNLEDLKNNVKAGCYETTLCGIENEAAMFRFNVKLAFDNTVFALAYLVEETEEKLKWTDLKVGDIIQNGKDTHMVIAIDTEGDYHVLLGPKLLNEKDLEDWKKA